MQNSHSKKRFFECETANGQTVRFRVNRRKKTASIIRIALPPETGSVVIPGTMYADDISCTVTAIGNRAFWGCRSLTSVTIPAGVTTIRYNGFKGCNRLTSINVAANNPKYSSKAGVLFDKNKTTFRYPQGKTGSYTIPDSVTVIGDHAFEGCKSLTSITIPNSVTVIGEHAFSGCKSLTSITIPDSVTVIEGDAFSGCFSLTSVSIPNSVTTISNGAFSCCRSLTSVSIPNSAFSNCDSLTSVIIPDSVTVIDEWVFYSCTSLISITIPGSVTVIGEHAFSCCESLTLINVGGSNPNYSSQAGVLFDKNKTTLIQYPQGKTGSCTIPESVTAIGNWAFCGCFGLTSVTVPDSVTVIGDSAFLYCEGLTSITIPDSVTVIGYSAFSGCKSLTSVTVPGSVTAIGEQAFLDCESLTSITVPESVTAIGEGAFGGCESLTSINVDSRNPNYSSAAGVLFDKDKTRLIRYPQGKTGTYTLPDSVTAIGDGAFSGCKSLTAINANSSNPNYSSVAGVLFDKDKTRLIQCPKGKTGSCTIPESVTVIGDWAFSGCKSITSVTIPHGVTVINWDAFYGCKSLTSAIISDSVTVIGSHAFFCCESLTEIHNRCVTPQEIDTSVFYGVNKRTCTLYVPESAVAAYKSAPGWKKFANIVGEIEQIDCKD